MWSTFTIVKVNIDMSIVWAGLQKDPTNHTYTCGFPGSQFLGQESATLWL